nr:DMP19 family protein [Prevotella sp.]
MTKVEVNDKRLREASEKEDMDAFVQVFIDAIKTFIGGELSSDNLELLNSDQITLLAWDIMHEEVMDGGVIQLIHNGYGPFIWKNPTDKAFRNWGLQDIYKWISKSHALYNQWHEDIEKDCNEDEFMSLFEKYPKFDDYDDAFVDNEETWTKEIAHYIDENIDNFAVIKNTENE